MTTFADFSLTVVVMVDESLPHKWFHRRGFYKARMLVLFTWLFFGNVLSMGYKSTLLSTLIPIREARNTTSNIKRSLERLYDISYITCN